MAAMVGTVHWLAASAFKLAMLPFDDEADFAELSLTEASRRRRLRNPMLWMASCVAAVLLYALAVPAALLIAMAMSRQREYLADASAVLFTRNPTALASALRKLSTCQVPLRRATGGTNHLFIVNPTRIANRLLSTHPPVEARIARILGTASMNAAALPSHAWSDAQPAAALVSTQQLVATDTLAAPAASALSTCPRCSAPLSERRIRAKVSRGCRSCGGTWIDAESVMELVASSPDTLRRFDKAFRNRVGYGWDRVGAKRCPDCGGALAEEVVSQDPRIAVDSCETCDCTWFDDGELAAFIWAYGKDHPRSGRRRCSREG